VPTKLAVHLVVDNYAAHKRPKVLEWLTHHPRFVFHFTPTSASWLNAVEGLFALLSKRRLKRGVFRPNRCAQQPGDHAATPELGRRRGRSPHQSEVHPDSLQELKNAIHIFIADTNANPKPFVWTKDPNKIIAAVKRGHQVLDSNPL
jgi:DDE superfamily endonuclease